ncbi:MAG: DUF3109 family protein [Bacteroidales bacterium]|nr:DUF3109 family protein [Bacteroidales bacterium]
MIVVGNSIVSDDIADRRFCCDCSRCHGACCVDGDSGAPLLEEEVPILEAILPGVLPYMTPEGRDAVREQGVAVRDKDGDLGTPLISGGACAYITYGDDGCALCAIEKAHSEKTFNFQFSTFNFPKPVSCHLYPIRVEDYGEFTAVNYHRWDICRQQPADHFPPLYVYLKEPLVRRFGQEWYDELLQEIKNRNEQQ